MCIRDRAGLTAEETAAVARAAEIYKFDLLTGMVGEFDELQGDVYKRQEFIQEATKQGVTIALGHSNATYEEAMAAVEAGASVWVHVYNGMRGFTHREPGMVGAAFDRDVYKRQVPTRIYFRSFRLYC